VPNHARATTLVVTLHLEAEGILRANALEFETFIRVVQYSIYLPSYNESEFVKIARVPSFEIKLRFNFPSSICACNATESMILYIHMGGRGKLKARINFSSRESKARRTYDGG
jgi:hypothetical protein